MLPPAPTLVAFAMLLAAAASMPLTASPPADTAAPSLNSALLTPGMMSAAKKGAPLDAVAAPSPPALAPSPLVPAIPSPPPCVMQDAPITFATYTRGAPVRDGDGFTLTTRRLGDRPLDDASAVFDSRRPTAGDADLGSPNAACDPAGAGVGEGGAPGMPGENCSPLGNLLIAHEGDVERLRARCAVCPTCDDCAPDDNYAGAEFEFTLTADATLTEITVVDVEQAIVVTDHTGVETRYAGLGDNGKMVVRLPGGLTPVGGKLKIRCLGSCGIGEIGRKRCQPPLPPACIERVVKFNEYPTGARIGGGEDWSLETTRLGGMGSTSVDDASAAFNTSMPTGDDADLGSPNAECPAGGPGIGVGGRPGTLGANCPSEPLGQVLIAHKGDVGKLRAACRGCPRGVRCAGCEPNDSDTGARFTLTFRRSVRLGVVTVFDLDDAARSMTIEIPNHVVYIAGLGDNSVQNVGLGWFDVPSGSPVVFTCAGSCAIAKFSYYPCVV